MNKNLISISGKIGSGKDTVATIIQYLICLDQDVLIEKYKDFNRFSHSPVVSELQPGHKIKKFAGKLKLIASIMLGIEVHRFEEQEVKDSFLPECWNKNGKPMTVRQFLQELGTNSVRDHLHRNAWVNSLFSDFTPDSKWIITDPRFHNEDDRIRLEGGYRLRVERNIELRYPELWEDFNKSDYDAWDDYLASINKYDSIYHSSETELDHVNFYHTIYNNGTLEDLIVKVQKFMIANEFIKSEVYHPSAIENV